MVLSSGDQQLYRLAGGLERQLKPHTSSISSLENQQLHDAAVDSLARSPVATVGLFTDYLLNRGHGDGETDSVDESSVVRFQGVAGYAN